MSVETNKELVRRYNEAVWSGDEATVRETLAPTCTLHGIGGPEQLLEIFRTFRQGIPNLAGTIDEQIAEGDKVMTRWTMRGTHSGTIPGPFGSMSGTGKEFTYTGITINRVENGKIVEDRFEADYFGLVQQLGGLPPPRSSED